MANDLFISYSHIDNRPWGPGQRCWVSELHEHLKTRLEMLLGREVRVWRDDKLAGNDELNDTIFPQLSESTLFLCVLSPRYLTSEWCRREIDLFLEHQARASGGAGKRPLFKVVKTRVDPADQPHDIKELLGYQFYREAPNGKVYELYPNRDEESLESQQFWLKLDDIAQDMQGLLARQAAAAAQILLPAQSPVSTAGIDRLMPIDVRSGDGRAVFLAESTVDINPERDKIRRELLQRGYRVLPERALPSVSDELQTIIEADLARACLSVHPVGARYGLIPEGETRSIVEVQIDAATRKNGHASHLIWISPEVGQSGDARMAEFLDRLRREYTERQGLELLEKKSVEELKTRMVEKLTTPPPAPAAQRTGPGQRIYLVCEPADVPAARALAAKLKALGFSVDLPLVEGSEAEIRQDHQETLVLCDAVLIYQSGVARQAWVRAKQRDVLKAPGWGRTKDVIAQAIYVAPSDSPGEEDSDGGFLVLRGGDPFSPDSLTPFVSRLQAASQGRP